MLRLKHTSGLTLIEVLTAVLLIAIISVVAIPLFTNIIQKYRISASSDQLYHILQYARAEAIKRNANVYLSFTPGDTWCYGVSLSAGCNCAVANSCGLGATSYGSAQQLSLSVTGLTGNAMTFEGTHGAANAAGTMTFTAYGQASPLVTISVGRMGNAVQCSTGINGYSAC